MVGGNKKKYVFLDIWEHQSSERAKLKISRMLDPKEEKEYALREHMLKDLETSEQNNKNVMHLYNIREGATDINLKKYMILIKNIRSIKSDFMIPLSLTNEDGTKQTLLHGDIVLNNIDSDLACFVMENKNYLILDTKINSIALETDSTRKYYQILNDDMVLLYPVDTLFKFDKKINIITTKITKTTNNITKIETKLDTTISDKKKNKLSNELKIIHQQINNLTDELRYYKELEQISMK